MKDRIKRVFSNSSNEVDAFIISNSSHPNLDPNFFYISGIDTGVFEHSYVIAYDDCKGIVLTSELEEEIARKETKLEVIAFKTKEEREKTLKRLLSGIEKLGINGNNLTHKEYINISGASKAEMVDISNSFQATRSVKDNDEIRRISEACKISSKVANEFPEHVKINITESDLSRKLVELQYQYGATNLAFSPPIVAFGKSSSEPHHFPSNNKIKKNEFVLVDFGAEYQRYGSDISRTFVSGKADQKMKKIYETVLDAQLRAVDMVRDGANGRGIDKCARGIIDRKFNGRFIHSLGHEVGLQVHDGNVLSSQRDFILKEDMVVTIEPGVYIPSIGGVRIEDTILVTKGKPKILTDVTKDLIEIH